MTLSQRLGARRSARDAEAVMDATCLRATRGGASGADPRRRRLPLRWTNFPAAFDTLLISA
jgi:hypothetical protein